MCPLGLVGDRRRALEHTAQSRLRRFDVATQRNPGQRLAGLFQDVVGERPITLPRLAGQRLALTRQIVEVAALLRLADLYVDRAFPFGEFLGRQIASAWIASARTSTNRLSCSSLL